ncbi:MAG: haloacid dehalogenase-like hydrolase [Polyangiaceae bacterium]|nr:haloacid dehalogenase-like hydrolase [Polyangiaceae bacterium]
MAHETSAAFGAATDTLPRCSTQEVIDRLARALDQLPQGARAAVAFDADNTIWKGDVGVDLFEVLLEENGIRPTAAEALQTLAREVNVGVGCTPVETARRLYESWEKKLTPNCPEDKTFAMMAWIYAGFTPDELWAFADRVLTARGIQERIRPEIRAIVEWARTRDVEVLVASASPRTPVEVGVRHLGIGPENVFAMTSKIEAGVLAPQLVGIFVYADGKATAVREGRPGISVLGGFGDSAYDGALMRMSAVPCAVSPGPGLLLAAPNIPGLIELVTT